MLHYGRTKINIQDDTAKSAYISAKKNNGRKE
jgi:hypothetical protein